MNNSAEVGSGIYYACSWVFKLDYLKCTACSHLPALWNIITVSNRKMYKHCCPQTLIPQRALAILVLFQPCKAALKAMNLAA